MRWYYETLTSGRICWDRRSPFLRISPVSPRENYAASVIVCHPEPDFTLTIVIVILR